MAEEVKEQVDPSGIPEFTGNLEQLEKDIAGLKKDASAIRETGTGIHSSFQGLSAFYDAPEAEQLFATTKPVREKADGFAGDLEKVTAALSCYATEARPLIAKLARLKDKARTFVGSLQGDEDWKEDSTKVDFNNALVREISATVAQFWEAERRAANKITALVGGTQWTVGDGSEGKNMYGLSVEDMKKAGETPWGSAVEQEYPLWRLDQHVKSFVWDGVIVDGIWGTLKGLGTLVNPWSDGFADAWKGLGQLATGLAMTSGLGALTYELMPDGPVRDWMTQSRQTTKQVGKELVAWDMWSENPARAAGLVSFNAVTTLASGGAGTAAKAGTAGKVLTAASKAGTVIDPMTYLGKGIGTSIKALPKITDITTGLKNLTSVQALELPDGTLRLPNGHTITPNTPLHDINLPPGKSTIDLPGGTTTGVPKGSVMTADNTFLTPNGDLIDSTGTLKQPANDAPTELPATDRTPDSTGTAVPRREPALTGAHNTPANTNAHADGNTPSPGGAAPDTPTASNTRTEPTGAGGTTHATDDGTLPDATGRDVTTGPNAGSDLPDNSVGVDRQSGNGSSDLPEVRDQTGDSASANGNHAPDSAGFDYGTNGVAGHDLFDGLGTRRDQAARLSPDSEIAAPPKESGDIVLETGDPVYFRDRSTAIGYDSSTLSNYDNVKPLDGHHDVVVHGNNKGYFEPGRVNAAGKGFPAGDTHPNHIADAIRNNPNYTGGPVRLVSCHSGTVAAHLADTSVPAAQALANELSVPVKAPTNKVGTYKSGGTGQEPVIFGGGYWRTFLPVLT
ncbi:hypothetical protein [Streptomyces gobiensis]|uniref:hypothetical protein n=1 Tax=Streptomyces gobiensis TaxID=2875706 RepID=UPI001E60456B|nr:hypothetical protein [Streptomyces gobiensis]UGY92837.1 hypothetical protein test1122_14750 [Streptomyces gobiensis]